MTEIWWDTNDDGCWCPHCGNCLSNRSDAEIYATECLECGFPEDPEKMANYHLGEEK